MAHAYVSRPDQDDFERFEKLSNDLTTPGKALKIGNALYQPDARMLLINDQQIRLEPRLAGLLDMLAARPGMIVRREDLLDEVWGDEGSDEALTQAVSRLRQLLGDRDLIRTEPRQGYSLMASPTRVAEPVAERPPAPVPARSGLQPTTKSFLFGVGAGLILALLIFLAFRPQPVTVIEEVSQPLTEGAEPERRSVRCEGPPEECEAELGE